MPNGEHRFLGAHDLATLRDGILVTVSHNGPKSFLKIKSKNIGHDFPTGDLLRYVSIEVKKNSEFKTIATLGRNFELKWSSKNQIFSQHLRSNTALKPFESRLYELPKGRPLTYRVVYHYTDEKNEARTNLSQNELIRTISSGVIK